MERTERHTAFALWFEQEFVRRGWNQSEVAERLGMSHNAIGKWINQGRSLLAVVSRYGYGDRGAGGVV